MPEDSILFKEENRLARVILNHSSRKNAITAEMRENLIASYQKWVVAADIYAITIEAAEPVMFSSGMDLKELIIANEQSYEQALAIFKNEYEAIWTIDCYTKPLIAMINGDIMGGGVGIAQYGTHIVAGENFSWRMPECKIGLFPDIGISYLLAKMPAGIGAYLGLTGRAINRDEACYLDLIEHCIDAAHFSNIQSAISDADPIDPILDGLHQQPETCKLAEKAPLIAKLFTKDTVEAIIDGLKAAEPEHQSWAQTVLEDLERASPISLKITLEAIKRAKDMQLDEALQQDYILVQNILSGPEFIPAIKAQMIEKKASTWTPATLSDVSNDLVESYFKPKSALKLHLPPRELGIDK